MHTCNLKALNFLLIIVQNLLLNCHSTFFLPSELLFLLVGGECTGEVVVEWPVDEARDSCAERGAAGDSRGRGGGGGD